MLDHRLYLVTDDPSRYRRDWLETIAAALDGGVTCVQYRDTENPPKVQYDRIRRLQDVLAPRHVPLIVNNDADLAAAVRAEGIHVGQGDLPPVCVRPIVGPRCEIGLSITDLSQVAAISASVDVLGIGPVYDARKTKADAAPEMGLAGLRAIADATRAYPNVAIGGITFERAACILSAGAGGLAVVSALSQADDPCAAAHAFRRLMELRKLSECKHEHV